MTTHELARQLLELEDVPVVHLYDYCDGIVSATHISAIGINLLEEDGTLVEVGLYPVMLLREDGYLDVIDHTLEDDSD